MLRRLHDNVMLPGNFHVHIRQLAIRLGALVLEPHSKQRSAAKPNTHTTDFQSSRAVDVPDAVPRRRTAPAHGNCCDAKEAKIRQLTPFVVRATIPSRIGKIRVDSRVVYDFRLQAHIMVYTEVGMESVAWTQHGIGALRRMKKGRNVLANGLLERHEWLELTRPLVTNMGYRFLPSRTHGLQMLTTKYTGTHKGFMYRGYIAHTHAPSLLQSQRI